jgi:O-antigen/teichoic acid export membrane protein
MVSGYFINIWLGRLLGPSDYGNYGIIIGLMTSVNIIQTTGLPQATSKFISQGKYKTGSVLKASVRLQIYSSIVFTILFFLMAPLFARLLNDVELTPYLQLASLVLPSYAMFSLYVGYYNGLHEFRTQAILNIIYSIAKAVLVIALVYSFHLFGAIVGFIISPLVALIFFLRKPPKEENTHYLHWPLIRFSLPIIGFSILSTLLISLDLFFVKSFENSASAGLYNAAQNIGRIPYFALNAFALVLLPTISQSLNNNEKGITIEKIRTAIRYLLMILLPLSALIAVTSEGLLKLIYGVHYLLAANALTILVLGLAFASLSMTLASILNAFDSPSSSMFSAGIGIIFAILADLILIPKFGLSGAAFGTTLGALFSVLSSYIFLKNKAVSAIPVAHTLKILAATTILILSAKALSNLGLFTKLVIPSGLYLLALFVLHEISKNDVDNLMKFLRKHRNS